MCLGILGRTVVDAVYVGENDELVGIEHGSDESGQLVVVGEHKFGDGDSVILVDDRNDAVVEHHAHAGTLVEVFAACGEALLHGEHLTDVQSVLAKEVVVVVYELCLSHSREQLPLLHAVELAFGGEYGASCRYGTGGDEYHLHATSAQLRHLVYEVGYTCDVQLTVVASQNVGTYLYYYSHDLCWRL